MVFGACPLERLLSCLGARSAEGAKCGVVGEPFTFAAEDGCR